MFFIDKFKDSIGLGENTSFGGADGTLASSDKGGSPALLSRKASSETRNIFSETTFKDPLFLRFKVFFDFTSKDGLLYDPLLDSSVDINTSNTAVGYLVRTCGKDSPYTKLAQQFISDLKIISSEYSFLFNEITGIGDLINADMQVMLPEDTKIEIRCIETLDMKIQALIENYRKFAFDPVRRVWRLPKNLRRFGMHVYVYPQGVYQIDPNNETEMQMLQKLVPTKVVESQNGTLEVTSPVLTSPQASNHVLYRLDECEIMLNGSGADFVSSLKNDEKGNPVNNLITIHPRRFNIDGTILNWWNTNANNMKCFASFVVGSEDSDWKSQLLDIAEETLLNAVSPLTSRAKDLINQYKGLAGDGGPSNALKNLGTQTLVGAAQYAGAFASNYVKTALNGIFYGNVYGFSADMLLTGMQGGVNGVATAIQRHIPSRNSKTNMSVGSNIYPEKVAETRSGTFQHGNVYRRM